MSVVIATHLKRHTVAAASARLPGGAVRTLRHGRAAEPRPKISEQSLRTFRKISDPGNAHLFSLEAALEAFAHVEV